jgi:ubiquinone/menaquinone biosynthesis C-methylase UbiE
MSESKEINLLAKYPKGSKNISNRLERKTAHHIRISRLYDFDYFDGSRDYGYGGYKYDGRWKPVAKDMIDYWGLVSGMRVLDIGCAKGFLVKDLMAECPGLEVFGIDISKYALLNAEHEVLGRLHHGNAIDLPFPDESFDAVICINTLHNLNYEECITALKEIERVTVNSRAYVQVDSYRTEDEKKVFLDWVLTAKTYGYPKEWIQIFELAGYKGDYYWTYV